MKRPKKLIIEGYMTRASGLKANQIAKIMDRAKRCALFIIKEHSNRPLTIKQKIELAYFLGCMDEQK
jgi:hypothetical protein